VTSEGLRTFTYDALGVTTGVNSIGRSFRFLYTADDERLAAVELLPAGNRTTWTLRGLDNQLLRTWSDASSTGTSVAWKEDVIRRGSLLLASETSSGTRHYILDHLGSPRLVSDATGNHTQSFSPFGEGGTSDGGALQFTGHERDNAEFGDGTADLPDYMHARFYDPGAGRLLSIDRAGGDPYFPQTWNRYAYARNNPLNRVDLDGNADTWFQRAAAATIGFGSTVQSFGASLNNGTALGTAADATMGTVGSLVQGYGDALNLGTSAGEVIGGGGDAYDVGMAASAEIGRASTIVGTVASVAQVANVPSTVIGGTTIPTADGPVTVRGGMVRSLADNGRGVVYRPAGETGDAGAVRVASPNASNPAGYARIYNNNGQPLVVGTGKPGPKGATHPALTGAATTTPAKAVVPPAPCANGGKAACAP